jgi:hypothetical protein
MPAFSLLQGGPGCEPAGAALADGRGRAGGRSDRHPSSAAAERRVARPVPPPRHDAARPPGAQGRPRCGELVRAAGLTPGRGPDRDGPPAAGFMPALTFRNFTLSAKYRPQSGPEWPDPLGRPIRVPPPCGPDGCHDRTLMTKFSDLALDPRVLQAISEAATKPRRRSRPRPFPTRCKAATFWASPRPAPARPPASRCR